MICMGELTTQLFLLCFYIQNTKCVEQKKLKRFWFNSENPGSLGPASNFAFVWQFLTLYFGITWRALKNTEACVLPPDSLT